MAKGLSSYFCAGPSSPQPTPQPVAYQNRGAYACFGGAVYPQVWQNEAPCNAYGCRRRTVKRVLVADFLC